MYIPNDSEYNNSRVINYNRWSDCKEVDALVTVLLVNIKSRKKSGYKNALKVLLLDLYQSYVTDKEQYIGYFRDMDHYHFKSKVGEEDRYVVNPHIAYFSLVGAVDMLIDEKFIESKTGSHYESEVLGEYGYLSKMRATGKLASLWEEYGFTTDMIRKFKQEEVIIKKDFPVVEIVKDRKTGKDKKVKKKYKFNYEDTAESDRMRGVVLAYNRQLDFTHIDCDAQCMSDIDKAEVIETLKAYKKDPVVRVDLSSKNVYRVFNNRSWEQGGRFYGAWWIGCPSVLRKYITLNGEPTVELDYSGIHIHLLYAVKGINYAKRKQDAYALDDGIPDRNLNKLILLTALNAGTETGARNSVYDQLRKEGRLGHYKFNRSKKPIAKKLALLKLKHSEIADGIAEDEGIKLQYLDSCIIEKLILFGIERDITVLTVHDSIICQAKHASLIKDKMWKCYSELLSDKLKCNIRYVKAEPHAASVMKALHLKDNMYKPPIGFDFENTFTPRRILSIDIMTKMFMSDDMIKISDDSRSNSCTGTCRHGVRVSNYKDHKRNYLGDIVVKLVDGGELNING
jgi:hypothetical protein